MLIIGPDNEIIRNTCKDICIEYLSHPVKKTDLSDCVQRYCFDSELSTENNLAGVRSAYRKDLQKEELPLPIKDQIKNNRLEESLSRDKNIHDTERRIATVMFADISGFTSMSEKMDPEDVTRIMNGCFQTLGKCIERHGGYIDKFIGDCIMAVFGVPETVEKAPQRALNAALEIRTRLQEYNKDNNLVIPLDVHIGINSGLVVAGMVGSDERTDYTVMGDTVNLAARLEDASESGQILAGPETYNVTKDEFEYRILPPISLKGKIKPVPVYELLSSNNKNMCLDIDEKRNKISNRMIFSPLVGRGNELNLLRLAVHKVINREGGIVSICSEPGLGKSRLMAELMRDSVMKQILFFEGRALSIGQNLSYYPFVDMIKKWSGINDDDSEKDSLKKFEKSVRSVHPEESDEIITFVGTLMGMNLPEKYTARLKGIEGEAQEKILFKNVRELFIKAAELKPTVVYIEDLHWADASSIELIISLLKLADNQRILFIVVFRPGYEATGEYFLKEVHKNFNRFHSAILLEPLDDGESAELIDNLLKIKGFPRTLKELIANRAGGNPFFIEEVIRSFIDQGAVISKNGIFQVTEKINKAEVPLTINEVIMSRIDRLDRETKALVKTASVIGRNFFRKIVIAVADEISDVCERLSYLEDIQLIREHNRMDELEYLFKHALAQEAAYSSILIQKRKEIHLQVAQAIESVFSERLHEFYGMLAYHYNMGDDFNNAEKYLIKAGEDSLRTSASNEAIYYFKQALTLYQAKYGDKADSKKVSMLEKNIGIALFNKGRYSECMGYMDRALKFYGETIPRNPLVIFTKAFKDFLIFSFGIYFPSFMWKREPEQYDKDILKILYSKGQAFAITEPLKFLIQTMYLARRLAKLDLVKIENENGAGIIASISILFSWSGVSYPLSRKIIEFVKDKIDMNNSKSVLYFNDSMLSVIFMTGDDVYKVDFDEELIKNNIINGEFMMLVSYFYWHNGLSVSRGDFETAAKIEKIIPTLFNVYNNIFAQVAKYHIRTYLLMKTRNLEEGLKESNKGIKFDSDKKEFSLWVFYLYSLKARMQIFTCDSEGAANSLKTADNIKSVAKTTPSVLGEFLVSTLCLKLYLLEASIKTGDNKKAKKLYIQAVKAKNDALKMSAKCAILRIETFKLAGVCFWLSGKYLKAFRHWHQGILEAQRIEERLELSRLYFEIGKRLCGISHISGNEFSEKKINTMARNVLGIDAKQCLDIAESMFREMNLAWDLDQLNSCKHG